MRDATHMGTIITGFIAKTDLVFVTSTAQLHPGSASAVPSEVMLDAGKLNARSHYSGMIIMASQIPSRSTFFPTECSVDQQTHTRVPHYWRLVRGIQRTRWIPFVNSRKYGEHFHGPLAKYAKLRVAHVPGMPGTFSPATDFKETTSQRSRHASRHVRHARAVMHVGIAYPQWLGKRSRHSRHMPNPQFYVSGKRPMSWHHHATTENVTNVTPSATD